MRALRAVVVCLAVLAGQGCMASTLVLHVRPDGSGRATITTRLYLSGMRAYDAIFAAAGTAPARPPQVEEELPPPGEGTLRQAFGTQVRLASTRLDKVPDGGIRTTEVEFDDIRELQLPFPPVFPPGAQRAHFDLLPGVTDAPFLNFAMRRHENGDRLLVVKLPNPHVANGPDAPVTKLETDSNEERLFKQAIKNMALQFFVEVEQPLLRSNAPRQEGSRVTILDLDLDRMINASDETRLRGMMAPGTFQEMLWQAGALPGAIIPTESEVFLEYEGPRQQAPVQTPQAPAAPAPPDSEIYLATLTSSNGRIALGMPANITNNPGYDNQPFFTPDGTSILFTSSRGGSQQTDIYRYELASARTLRITQTAEGEYSPTPMLDNRRISTVTVEADRTQRLWAVARDGSAAGRDMLLPDQKPVGYHAWADATNVALFILGSNGAPATLHLADTRTGTARVIATDIGRSLLRMPGDGTARHISFVQRQRDADKTTLVVKELDPATGAVTTLTPAVEGSSEADLAWTADGTLLMVKDDVLYAWTRGQSGWREAVKLALLGLNGVTRLAVSPAGDRLALVGRPPR